MATLLAVSLVAHGLTHHPNFLFQRIVSTAAIWLGVLLVTFAAVHLAPLDVPLGRGDAGFSTRTAAERETFRRTHGLHLPVFLNFDIRDRRKRILSDLDLLTRDHGSSSSPNKAATRRAQERLLKSTSLTFPELPQRLKKKPNPRLRQLLFRILKRIAPPDAPKRERREALLSWWRRHRREFQRPSIQAVVRRAVGGDAQAQRKVRWLHARAVPALVPALDRDDKTTQERACAALSHIVGRAWRCRSGAAPKERRASMTLWREHLRGRELHYTDLSSWGHFTGVITRTRFYRWFTRLMTLEFGASRYFGRPVSHILWERLPITLTLGLAALLLAYLVAVPLGVLAGSSPGSPRDKTLSLLFMALYCLPVYWAGMVLMTTLGGIHGPALFPHSGVSSPDPSGWPLGSVTLDRIWHLTLPVVCLSLGSVALLGRYGRDAMADTLTEDYMRTAWAKGLPPWRVYWVHGLRNASLPQIHLLGLQIPYLLSGSVLVERIFDIPGLGLLAFTAIEMRDFNLLMGLISLTALLTLGGQVLADLLALYVDPRTWGSHRGSTGPRLPSHPKSTATSSPPQEAP